MFTQRLSMDCTKEQYEKYLKDELLKMGYKEYSINCWDDNRFHHISNDYNGYIGDLGTICKDSIENRTYLGSFNAPLFLALAAMTNKEEGNYGEYFIGLISGRFYRVECNEWVQLEHTLIRKATKEEIMAKFGDVKISEKNKCPLDFTCETTNEILSDLWYKIDQYHIAALKSKGYKIMRKTETWEEV